jgi:hypothetical protein
MSDNIIAISAVCIAVIILCVAHFVAHEEKQYLLNTFCNECVSTTGEICKVGKTEISYVCANNKWNEID